MSLCFVGVGCDGGDSDGGGGGVFTLAAINATSTVLSTQPGSPSVAKLTFTITGPPNTSVQFLAQFAIVSTNDGLPGGGLDATEAPGDVIMTFEGELDSVPGQTEMTGPNGTVNCVFYWWLGSDLGFTCPTGQNIEFEITPFTNGNPSNPNGTSDSVTLTENQLNCIAPNPSFPTSGDPVGNGGRAGMNAHLVGAIPPATGLSDADILIVGGYNAALPFPFSTADLLEFDFNQLTHSNNVSLNGPARRFHACEFFIGSDGTIKVLVTGGDTAQVNPSATPNSTDAAEVYCFSSTTASATEVIDGMVFERRFHTATWLPNNKILVVGGSSDGQPDGVSRADPAASTAEIFDPVTQSFSLVAAPNHPRHRHTACLLPNGRVLVAGGSDPAATDGPVTALPAEIYNPVDDSWMDVPGALIDRVNHTCTTLIDGNILLVGGRSISTNVVLGTVDLFDCSLTSFTATISLPSLSLAREFHTATRVGNGQLLVVGGFGNSATALASAEVLTFTPTAAFSPAASLLTGRAEHVAVATNPGNIVVMGGKSGSASSPLFLDSVEFYPYNNTPPGVMIPFTPTFGSPASVPITFILDDIQGDSAFVVIQWSSDFGVNWNIATIADPCNTTTNLAPGSHTVTWNASADGASGVIVIRILPFGGVLGSPAIRQIVLP